MMWLLFDYMKLHWKGGLLSVCFCAVFVVVLTLFGLPVQAVGYAAIICIFFGVVLFVIDFHSFYRKNERLIFLRKEICDTLEHLPPAAHLIERDYQDLIRDLYENKIYLKNQLEEQYSDLVEYYTMWAHQIKTPIAAMYLLLQGADSPLKTDLCEELMRIEQYVEMALIVLRLDSKSTDYLIRTYDLDQIVRQAVRKYAPQFIRKKIKLEYSGLECCVLTDEKWLLFVIEQVLSNALKYTRKGTITIDLESPKTLCIRDTGIGIEKEDLPRIFEKGFTGYNGRADKKSTGIGLYLCRRVVRNLGHEITAESEPGAGTVIRIDLASASLEVE